MKKLITSSDLTMVRSNVEHICFVDIDSVPSFFEKCDDKFNTARRLIPPGVFVWCFCSRVSDLSTVIGRHTSFYSLLMAQQVEVDYTPATRPDASDIALAMCVGQLHADILLAIPFTIISSENAFSEVAPRLRDRDVIHVRPTSHHWPEVLASRLRPSDGSPATVAEPLVRPRVPMVHHHPTRVTPAAPATPAPALATRVTLPPPAYPHFVPDRKTAYVNKRSDPHFAAISPSLTPSVVPKKPRVSPRLPPQPARDASPASAAGLISF